MLDHLKKKVKTQKYLKLSKGSRLPNLALSIQSSKKAELYSGRKINIEKGWVHVGSQLHGGWERIYDPLLNELFQFSTLHLSKVIHCLFHLIYDR